MQFIVEKHARAAVASVSGRLDTITAPEFDVQMRSLPVGERVILDLHETVYVSSAGLRSILEAAKHAKASGGSLELAGLRGGVREVFDISGFLGIFLTHESVADALKE